MKQSVKDTLFWFFTILIVPAIIMVTFLINGYLGIRLF